MIGFYITALLFSKEITIASMFITSVSDSVAAIFGMKYGKIKLINNKSLEGFIVFIVSTYIILFFTLEYQLFLPLYIISIISASIELCTPTKFGNLTISIGTALILYILFNLI